MNCIVGGRGNGKTAALIRLSAETGYTIVTMTREGASNIKNQASKMGVDIPRPECVRDFQVYHPMKPRKGVLVDEAGMVLSNMLGTRVECATFEGEAYNPTIKRMGLLQRSKLFRSMGGEPRIASDEWFGDGIDRR